MNVFVLSTGRCGSTTFAKACAHITNFSAAHESLRRGGENRNRERYQSIRYPERHIEVDNRLSWFLGALDDKYGGDAFYVHLLRDREQVAESFLNRWEQQKTNIIFSFAWGVLTHPRDQVMEFTEEAKLKVGRQYWETVNSNIRLFLRDKPHQMTIWLDNIKGQFSDFWERIGAEGNFNAALNVWETRYNASSAAAPSVSFATRNAEKHASGEVELASTSAMRIGDFERHQSAVSSGNEAVHKCHDPNEAVTIAVRDAEIALKRAMQSYRRVDLQQIQPPVEPDRWTLEANTLRLLISLVDELEPTHAVEFGSGLSTRVLDWACARSTMPCHITSLDHDPDFLKISRDGGAPGGGTRNVTVLSAPLVARKVAGKMLPVYHFLRDEVASIGDADLILIDGPPRALGGREGALYQAMDLSRPGTLILLDDALRKEEMEAVESLQRTVGSAVHLSLLPGFLKGLLAIIVRNPVRLGDPAFSDAGGEETTTALLESIERLGTDATWIVIDDGILSSEAFAGLRNPILPFLEQDGQYWGAPVSDAQAIEEVQRMRASGARYLAIAGWSFWWFEYYEGFRKHLESCYQCVVQDEDLVVFDLQGAHSS